MARATRREANTMNAFRLLWAWILITFMDDDPEPYCEFCGGQHHTSRHPSP